jgi:hypothetical protein
LMSWRGGREWKILEPGRIGRGGRVREREA